MYHKLVNKLIDWLLCILEEGYRTRAYGEDPLSAGHRGEGLLRAPVHRQQQRQPLARPNQTSQKTS